MRLLGTHPAAHSTQRGATCLCNRNSASVTETVMVWMTAVRAFKTLALNVRILKSYLKLVNMFVNINNCIAKIFTP